MEAALECVRTKMHMIDIDASKLPGALLDSLAVSQADFNHALTVCNPSALRETAVEIPDVSWDDVGGLEDVKRELQEMVQDCRGGGAF